MFKKKYILHSFFTCNILFTHLFLLELISQHLETLNFWLYVFFQLLLIPFQLRFSLR